MTKLTRSNIAYDLTATPHYTTVEYENGDTIVFMFSSALYVSKFLEKLSANREAVNISLSQRFKFEISMFEMADVQLYTKIEKRGFRIIRNGVSVECRENLQFAGSLRIKKP